MPLGSVTVALVPLGPRIRKGLSSTCFPGPTSRTQTCRASQQGVGQSCRLEQTCVQADPGSPRQPAPSPPQDSNWLRVVTDQCPELSRTHGPSHSILGDKQVLPRETLMMVCQIIFFCRNPRNRAGRLIRNK